jgi:DNA-binding transcriptional MocR family regulator
VPAATSPPTRSDSAGPDLTALLGDWSATGHGSLARRLEHALRSVIDAGVVPGGWRLPPERSLAKQLAVGRTTVKQALDALRRDGRLYSRQGSGTSVVGPPSIAPVGTRVAEHLASGLGIDLAKGDAPDLSHLPSVRIDLWQLNATCGGAAVYPAGLPALRQAIAERYSNGGSLGHARATNADQIHVTAGGHQASHLLISTLAGRGATVALAEYSYPGLFDILDVSEARPVPVRMDRGGMVPESLDDVLTRHRPALVYAQAGPQIPTGQVAGRSRLRALGAVLDRHGATVIEDTTLAALAFAGLTPMLSEHCRTARVITTGSLSKLCWSGIRLGWLRADTALIEQTSYRHLGFDLGASVPSQVLALQLLPNLEAIAATRRTRLERRVDAALEQLARTIPQATITRPAGGSILWVQFPLQDTSPLVTTARQHGVLVAPGSIHTQDRQPGPFVRIDVDRAPAVVDEGLHRLAQAWASLRRRVEPAKAAQ